MENNILLLEDDTTLSKEIISFFNQHQIQCEHVSDGIEFLKIFNIKQYSIFILDINVPRINGVEILKEIRKNDKETPVLMLTAYSEIEDKQAAFDAGADDYLAKPFHLNELLMRIKSLAKRVPFKKNDITNIINIEDLEINLNNKTVKRKNLNIDLTPKEYKLLISLANADGKIVSKKEISEYVWNTQLNTNMNTIEVYINFLRKKIDKDFDVKLIHTRSGFGYYLGVQHAAI